MTDETTETETTDETPTGTTVPVDETTETEGRKGSPEAAKWRVKLREAEGQVSTLTERVTALQRADVVRQATGAGLLIDGDDVFRGRELADLLDEEGNVDADLVTAAITATRESKPHLSKPFLNGDVGLGTKAGARPVSWSDVIGG